VDWVLIIFALCSAVFVALALVLTQFGLRTLTPLTGATISVPTTAAIFVAISPLSVEVAHWHGPSVLLFALAGAFFPVTVTLLTFASNRRLGPTITGALGNLTPLFAVVLAVVLIAEAPASLQIVGMLCVVSGAFAIYLGRSPELVSLGAWTFALPIGAALMRGLVQPVVKAGLDTWPNPFAAAVTIGYLVSAAILVGARLFFLPREAKQDMWGGGPWFVAVGVCNGAANLTMYAALTRGPVAIVAPLVATYPLVVLVLNRMLRRDVPPSRATIMGVLMIVAGVAVLLSQ
jgi:drug/metabolite transporter (DMT)-like permease